MSAAPSLCSLAALTDEATLSPLVELTLGIGSEGGSNPCIPPDPVRRLRPAGLVGDGEAPATSARPSGSRPLKSRRRPPLQRLECLS